MKLIAVSILAIAILLGGCTKTTPAPEPAAPKSQVQSPPAQEKKPGDYFPLTKGSTWQYLGEGNEYASFRREVLAVQDNLAQLREDNGGTVSASVFKKTDDQIVLIFFQGETYNETNFLTHQPNENLPILKAPLKVGTKWQHPTGTREIIDDNATVNTPAGNFAKCIVVKISSPNSTTYEYFSEGVGMVKREFITGNYKVTSKLEKYNITS
ncbi:hypothetical protein JCM39194_13900 [Desulfotomaculum varum]